MSPSILVDGRGAIIGFDKPWYGGVVGSWEWNDDTLDGYEAFESCVMNDQLLEEIDDRRWSTLAEIGVNKPSGVKEPLSTKSVFTLRYPKSCFFDES